MHRVAASAAEVQRTQVGVYLLEVGHRRHDTVFQYLDRDHIFYPDAHRMAGEALGVGDNDLIGRLAEDLAQGHHLGGGAAAAGRRVGLVRDKDRLGRNGVPVDAETALGSSHQIIHHQRDMLHIQARAVKGAVVGLAAEQFDDAAHTPLTERVFALHNQGASAHAHDGPMPAAVERQRRFFHLVLRGGSADGEEARADPLQQIVAGHVVRADDNHPPATAAADPVLGDGDGLSGAGAGGIDLRVRPSGADELGELAMAHAENTEEEAAIEEVRLGFQLLAQHGDPSAYFGQCRLVRRVPA